MFKLFGSLGAAEPAGAPARNYSRFSGASAALVEADAEEKLTRFKSDLRAVEPRTKIIPKRPARTPANSQQDRTRTVPARRSKFNDMAHLHASDQIPMWVFHKALPKRFSEMHSSNDEFVFQ